MVRLGAGMMGEFSVLSSGRAGKKKGFVAGWGGDWLRPADAGPKWLVPLKLKSALRLEWGGHGNGKG